MGVVNVVVSNFLSNLAFKGRVFLGLIAVVCIVGPSWYLSSNLVHRVNGVAAVGELVGRIEECKAEFQPVGQSRRREIMPCARAYAFRAAAGEKKVRVTRNVFALVRFPMGDGTYHLARVAEGAVQAEDVAVGSPMHVVYDPARPDDVRAAPGAKKLAINLGMVVAGLVILPLVLFGGRMLGWLLGGGEARPQVPVDEQARETSSTAWDPEALKQAAAARAGTAARPVVVRASDRRQPAHAGAPAVRRQFGLRS